MKRGKVKYVPSVVLVELEDLKEEHNISEDSVALRELVKYARSGREMERIMRFKFGRLPTDVSKRKRKGGLMGGLI